MTVGLVTCTWVGFVVAALGDAQKSIFKSRKGDDALATKGIFQLLRHPNFTGETFGWTASFLAAISIGNWKQNAGLLAASALGWMGICFVLAMATTNLEKKQKEKYGDTFEYQEWVKGSWAGFTLKKKGVIRQGGIHDEFRPSLRLKRREATIPPDRDTRSETKATNNLMLYLAATTL